VRGATTFIAQEPQSAFWHIGAMTNTTDVATRLRTVGITHLPLFTSPADTHTVWRSGLAPYTGTLTTKQLATAPPAPPRDGGFSYVVAPDGVLFELTAARNARLLLAHALLPREAAVRRELVRRAARHGAAAGARQQRRGDAA
jgi:hypothetical protein